MEINKIYNGNCLEVLKSFPDNSVDSVVTDPPYGISFMNKHWDYDVPKVEVWQEIYRVLKQGGHVLCACGTRTQHRMAVNIEDAGFEIRDVITWHYGSGFPKSLDIGKAIDKLQGNEREIMPNPKAKQQTEAKGGIYGDYEATTTISKGNSEYEGWGTALKPATEFWTLARKPLSEKTVAENVLKYDTGGINIDGSRIETTNIDNYDLNKRGISKGSGIETNINFTGRDMDLKHGVNNIGRFPANVIFDEFTGKLLDDMTGILTTGKMTGVINNTKSPVGEFGLKPIAVNVEASEGGASRFFYCPKADNYERNKGLKGFDKGQPPASARSKAAEGRENALGNPRANHHPTVKPIDLMRYLVKLITPKKGICLDPYCGSGTTLVGCKMELINYIGIEREEEYCKIAEARVAAWNPDKYKPQQLF